MDPLSAVGAGTGYVVLTMALILLWRMFQAKSKDADYYRDRLFQVLDKAEPVSEAAEKLITSTSSPPGLDHLATLREVVDLLAGAKKG